jgi:hypothetical protein
MTDAFAEALFDEITDFLLSQPSAEDIIAFRASSRLDERLHTLLENNREDEITSEEKAELEAFIQYGHLLTTLKIKARRKLAG